MALAGVAMLDKDPENMTAVAEFGSHNKMARGAKDRERKDREQNRIKPGNHGHASNSRVAEDLGDIHRRERYAGKCVAQHRFPIEGP